MALLKMLCPFLVHFSLLSAAPTSPTPSCPTCSKSYNVGFDDIAKPPFGLPDVGGIIADRLPTPYNGLEFANFSVASQALIPAVVFHSPPNTGSTGTISALQGVVQALKTDYSGSKVTSFDLHDFYFGCKLSTAQQANGGPTQACTIKVTGYKQDPQHPSVCDVAGPQIFGFQPGALGLFGVEMVHAVLDDTFDGLTNVTIELTSSEVLNQLTILYSDNYNYTTHGVCCS